MAVVGFAINYWITPSPQTGGNLLLADLLQQFPKGSRVRVDITDAPTTEAALSAEGYRLVVEAARLEAPTTLWKSSTETMAALREGE